MSEPLKQKTSRFISLQNQSWHQSCLRSAHSVVRSRLHPLSPTYQKLQPSEEFGKTARLNVKFKNEQTRIIGLQNEKMVGKLFQIINSRRARNELWTRGLNSSTYSTICNQTSLAKKDAQQKELSRQNLTLQKRLSTAKPVIGTLKEWELHSQLSEKNAHRIQKYPPPKQLLYLQHAPQSHQLNAAQLPRKRSASPKTRAQPSPTRNGGPAHDAHWLLAANRMDALMPRRAQQKQRSQSVNQRHNRSTVEHRKRARRDAHEHAQLTLQERSPSPLTWHHNLSVFVNQPPSAHAWREDRDAHRYAPSPGEQFYQLGSQFSSAKNTLPVNARGRTNPQGRLYLNKSPQAKHSANLHELEASIRQLEDKYLRE